MTARAWACFDKVHFSKLSFPNAYFSKVYFPKVYFSKVLFPNAYFPKCIFQTCISSLVSWLLTLQQWLILWLGRKCLKHNPKLSACKRQLCE